MAGMMRFASRSMRSFGVALLASWRSNEDVQLAPVPESLRRSTSAPENVHVEVVRRRWRGHVVAVTLFLTLAAPTIFISAVLRGEWQSRPANRGWLLLGFGFYISAASRAVWARFVRACETMMYLPVELRKFISPTLFEAVTDALAREAERQGLTCSWDQEAVQESNSLTGELLVKLRFWSSQERTMKVCLSVDADTDGMPGELVSQIQFRPGEDIVFGRDHRVERREVLILSTRTSGGKVLVHKAFLTKWLQQCYNNFTRPEEGILNVYALQESSSDWMPEWKFERVKPCNTSSGKGPSFFLERGALKKVLAGAKLW